MHWVVLGLGLGALLGAAALAAIGAYLIREAKRNEREWVRIVRQEREAAAMERADLINRLQALVDKPWELPPAATKLPPEGHMPLVEDAGDEYDFSEPSDLVEPAEVM